MGSGTSIFSFLCFILVVACLYHFYHYEKCQETKKTLYSHLEDQEEINNKLYGQYEQVNSQYHQLKSSTSKKIHKERFITEENDRHAVAMTNVIPVQYQRLLQKTNQSQPYPLQEQHQKLRHLQKVGETLKPKTKILCIASYSDGGQNTKNSQKPYLLNNGNGNNASQSANPDLDHDLVIPGEEAEDYHPYSFGDNNDAIFGIFSLKQQIDDHNLLKGETESDEKQVYTKVPEVSVYDHEYKQVYGQDYQGYRDNKRQVKYNQSGCLGGSGGSGNTGGIGDSGHYTRGRHSTEGRHSTAVGHSTEGRHTIDECHNQSYLLKPGGKLSSRPLFKDNSKVKGLQVPVQSQDLQGYPITMSKARPETITTVGPHTRPKAKTNNLA